jgi:predicted DNA-binding transcriptional regulator YafY
MGTRPSSRRTRQVVRLLAILKVLLDGGRPSVHQLAARFHTRRETIYRDLRALQDVGYPIVGDEEGRLSRPRLASGVRTTGPPVTLTRPELAALVWSVKHAGDGQPFRAALGTVLPKLQALAAPGGGGLPLALDGAIEGRVRGAKDYAGFTDTILHLVQAIVERRPCRVEYQAIGRARPRAYAYEPFRIVAVHGGLYAIGRVPPHMGLTTLAIDRIRSLALTDGAFTVPAAFDPKRLAAEAFGVVWERPMTVVVRFGPKQAPYVREREWHPTQRLRSRRDGGIELTFRAGGRFEIARWILGWGDGAEVLRPARLRREIAGILRAAARRYR